MSMSDRQRCRDETTASVPIKLENTMLRKVTLGLIAATALTLAAAAPASAAPFHHHGHWVHGWGHGYGLCSGRIHDNTGYDSCLQQRWVRARRASRLCSVSHR